MRGVRAGVGVFIFDEKQRVLLVKQNYGNKLWAVPGGAIDPGETPQDAALRELREETGLEAELRALIGLNHYVRDGVPRVHFAFEAEITGGTLGIQEPSEIAVIGWHDPSKPPSPLTGLSATFLPPALRGERGLLLNVAH
jgi:8-oxo-dGTP diphosphatase